MKTTRRRILIAATMACSPTATAFAADSKIEKSSKISAKWRMTHCSASIGPIQKPNWQLKGQLAMRSSAIWV
jgi:hypothetical protein